jgi:ATP-dependent DNA helicase RecG
MTIYNDLDLSIIKERPPGRQPVQTYLVRPAKKADSLDFVRKELRAGRQAFFVYPLVEESEKLDLPAAVAGRERLATEVFPEYRVGLVHGRLSSEEKDEALDSFRAGRTQILVATSVIEVGIDVPNATVLYVENAGRFGLAQLHQLRGRVGRGIHGGYCLVSLEGSGEEALKRLDIFAGTDDGFKLAEEDLRLRGPGDYLGIRQSGLPFGGFGNPVLNVEAFMKVRTLAEDFWERSESAAFIGRWGAILGLEESPEEAIMGLD